MTVGDRVRWSSKFRGPLSKRKGTERYVRPGELGTVIDPHPYDSNTSFSQIAWDNGYKTRMNKHRFLREGGRVITVLDLLMDVAAETD